MNEWDAGLDWWAVRLCLGLNKHNNDNDDDDNDAYDNDNDEISETAWEQEQEMNEEDLCPTGKPTTHAQGDNSGTWRRNGLFRHG